MSSTSTGFPEDQKGKVMLGAGGSGYVPTEEEKRVFQECSDESFRYRSLPFALSGMAITHALVLRGYLPASPRFGSLPKMAFAGLCGYLMGKMSYMKECQEKFKRLENSPLGEALREMETDRPKDFMRHQKSVQGDQDTQSYMYQPATDPRQTPSQTRDFEYGFRPDPPMQVDRGDDFSAPAPAQLYEDEEQPKRKPVLYEDLRLKNRENYEVTLTQKAETLLIPETPEKERDRPSRKEVKTNIYGDAWEE